MTRLLQSVAEDIRFAFRMMKNSLGLTSVAVLSLGLGIGATIAIFSVIYALALKSLPVFQSDRLVEVGNLHYAEWKLFRGRQDIFSSVASYNWFHTTFDVANPDKKREISGRYVSGDYFPTLGVSTVLGRALQPPDDQPGAPRVCVIGYRLWRQLYGQSRDILGRTIRVNGNEFQIVGVAPPSFFGVEVGDMPEIFMPLEAQRTFRDYPLLYGKHTPSLDDPHYKLLSIIGRLKPGESVSQANAGLQVLSPEIYRSLPTKSDDGNGRAVVPQPLVANPIPNGISDTWLQDIDMMLLLMIMAAVALVIACANLGNLLLARAAKRQGEIATRLALGATRWRLIRQLLTESVALSVVGAALGLLVARWGTQALLWALSWPDQTISLDLSWDMRLVLFAVGITLFGALLFGLTPAIGATRISLNSSMNNGVTTGKRKNRFTNSVLVAVQVALSVAVIVSAGLLARTLQAYLAQDLGYDPKGVLGAQASWQGAGENPQGEAMVGEELLRTFRSLPGVTSASWSRIFFKTMNPQVVVPGPNRSERRLSSYLFFVSSDFFSTKRTPMLAGRDFTAADSGTSFPVAILSEHLAKVLFGAVNPVGLRFRENDSRVDGQDYTVEAVGVAKDIQYRKPGYVPLPILFRPVSQCGSSCSGIGSYEIRAVGPLAETAKRLEAAAAKVDARIVLKCDPLSNAMNGVLHRNRALAWIATTFSLFVGLLAMLGVYGVTSYATAERTREIGIRMALGAQRANVLHMVFGETIWSVCIGAALGAGASVAAAGMFRGLIWGVKPTDPLSFGTAIGLMLLIAGIAAFLPARRAMRVDPMVALRFE